MLEDGLYRLALLSAKAIGDSIIGGSGGSGGISSGIGRNRVGCCFSHRVRWIEGPDEPPPIRSVIWTGRLRTFLLGTRDEHRSHGLAAVVATTVATTVIVTVLHPDQRVRHIADSLEGVNTDICWLVARKVRIHALPSVQTRIVVCGLDLRLLTMQATAKPHVVPAHPALVAAHVIWQLPPAARAVAALVARVKELATLDFECSLHRARRYG